MIRTSLAVICALVLAGCAPAPAKKGAGFGSSIGQAAVEARALSAPPQQLALAAVPANTVAVASVPSYTVKSWAYRKRGKPTTARIAAGRTREVGMQMFAPPVEKLTDFGDFKIGVKHVRYDNHDFIVVSYRPSKIRSSGAQRWQGMARQQAEAVTSCALADGWYAFGQYMAPARIYKLSC